MKKAALEFGRPVSQDLIHVDAQPVGALEEREAEDAGDHEIEVERK